MSSEQESEVGSFYRRRSHTRREALDRIMKHRGRPKLPEESANQLRNLPQDQPVREEVEYKHEDTKGRKQLDATTVTTASMDTACTQPAGYSALMDDSLETPVKQVIDDIGDAQYSTPTRRKPLHLETHEEEDTRYYRIAYQGVVALLSEPLRSSSRSGVYVSYGEIITSRHEEDVEEDSIISAGISPQNTDVGSPPQSLASQNAGSVSSLDTLRTASTAAPSSQITQSKSALVQKKMVRVDEVLTGGYAVDARGGAEKSSTRSNHLYMPMVGPSPLPLALSDSMPKDKGVDANYGYLFTRKKNTVIAERLSSPPFIESGTFLFKIVSSSPLPILTGPCVDAPKTKAMLLPGTVHEVCLKLTTVDCDVCFLRLSHRRGWITDRMVTSIGGLIKIGAVPAAKEITETIGDDVTISQMSSVSIASTGSSVRRRHRPPRRKQESEKSGLPRHVGGPQNQTTPVKGTSVASSRRPVSPGAQDKSGTPSSNVSMLSDDESFDLGSQYRFPSGLTPDRSVAKSKQCSREAPTFFLMHVNAPRGLKILDAPHFQVSNLIHGKHDAKSQPQISGSASGANSLFHTTHPKGTSQFGNPAVFDSLQKTRILPRGVMFEAAKRVEASGAFNRGAGLIKLSDNSGWAIVPRQEELDAQYRNYQGGVATVKQGEATRAFEEVGNAICESDVHAHETRPSIWVRVVSKNGVPVSCPPPAVPVAKDDGDTSPTSSAGGSSSVSGVGSNYGILSGDSDVASSVGSAFLDAMFRTPKKCEPSTIESRTHQESFGRRKDLRPASNELERIPNILPCGSCVEVDNWEDTGNDARLGQVCQDYVRLRGGQGWIPLVLAGKPCSVVVPKPDIRLGSFWFRVTSQRGIKVRLGPSRKAGSIKTDDGIYFRFECGEFLRASEVVTIFHDHAPSESFAKLYRNRHVRLNQQDSDYRQLLSLTSPSEWVQVHSDDNLFLEECGTEPQILRHREGWRYNVLADSGVTVRRGPSFDAEATGVSLLVGESVLITERVMIPGEEMTWLRLKDGEGWVYDSDSHGRATMIAHSLRHRTNDFFRPHKTTRPQRDEIAYNSIVARLFHEGRPGNNHEGRPGNKHEGRPGNVAGLSNTPYTK